MARTGRHEEEAPHKAAAATNRHRVQQKTIWMCIIMASANCSPALASRRVNYNADLQVPTFLGARAYRFARDDKEPGPSWGKQLPGERPSYTAET
jgi:hypothetical protein